MAGKLFSLSIFSFFFILLSFSTQVLSVSPGCEEETNNPCNNKHRALPLKIIAIASILATSMIGVCLPLVTRSVPALSPDRDVFVIAKSFAAGIILATGFMHVLPDSFGMLSSSCLSDKPWHNFPFSGFVAMLSAIVTLMVDSVATSLYSKKHKSGFVNPEAAADGVAHADNGEAAGFHHHHHGSIMKAGDQISGSKLLRYRVIAMVIFLVH